MTVASWPSELPRPERDTWQASPQDGRVKRSNDAGPPGYRQGFSASARDITQSILVDRDQKAIFDNFFKFATSGGSTVFWMPDPTTDGWKLLTSDGSPLLIGGGPDDGKAILLSALSLCTFGDTMPSEAVVGTRFRITFSVVVLP